MKKCWMIALVFSFLLAGCSKMDIQIEWNYGVRYQFGFESNEYHSGSVTIFLDPQNPDVVAALFVTCFYESDAVEQERVALLKQENSTNYQNKHEKTVYDYHVSYSDQEIRAIERIHINFSAEDLNLCEHPLLIEQLGLEKELKDGILYYEKELLKSETFRYKWIMDNGEFIKNISIVGDPQFDYPDYQENAR